MFQSKDIFIFDLDGTLIDSLGMWNEVDRLLITFLGGDPLEEHARQVRRETILSEAKSEPDPYLVYCSFLKDVCKSELSPSDIKKKRYEISASFLRSAVSLKPGAAEVLHFLKQSGKTLVLASSTSRANVHIYSTENPGIYEKAYFPDLFSLIYTRDDVTQIKPSPDVYEKVLHTLGVPAEKCVAFEDSLAGVQAAKAAGLDVVCMYDTYSEADKEVLKNLSSLYFYSFSELKSALFDVFHA